MNSLQEIADWIRSHDGFGIIAHVSPDGDALGSELALYAALKKMGKKVCPLCADPVTYYCSFLPGAQDVSDTVDIHDYPYMISVDCADGKRIGKLEELYFSAEEYICIDHHSTNPFFGMLNYVEERAANGEIIYLLLKELECPLDKDIATCLYTAIATDTGDFAFSNTTSDSYRIAAELVDCGIDLPTLNSRLFSETTLGSTRLSSLLIRNMILSPDGRVCVSTLDDSDFSEANAAREDAEDQINTLRNIIGVEASAVLKRAANGDIRVSMRGKSYADVSKIAASHGGGGHKLAAGCTLHGDMAEQRNLIYNELLEAVKEKA